VIYHDEEWGRAVHDDRLLFEMLILEGAQAGLSWEIVLKKRAAYQKLFSHFDVVKCSRLTDARLEKILMNPEIIRHRLKVFSVRQNAQAFLKIQKEFGTFDRYLWNWVKGRPIINRPKAKASYATRSPLSDALSKDLKQRGFKFVGTTIIYAYLQAVGVINEHSHDCFFA
jgi:DNA-3-methyladenine glycosylase I